MIDETLQADKATTTICTAVAFAAPKGKIATLRRGHKRAKGASAGTNSEIQSRSYSHSHNSKQISSSKSGEGELDLEINLEEEEFDEEDRQ